MRESISAITEPAASASEQYASTHARRRNFAHGIIVSVLNVMQPARRDRGISQNRERDNLGNGVRSCRLPPTPTPTPQPRASRVRGGGRRTLGLFFVFGGSAGLPFWAKLMIVLLRISYSIRWMIWNRILTRGIRVIHFFNTPCLDAATQ